MELICSNCGAVISPENVNISTDLAKCDMCNSIHKASELVDRQAIGQIEDPPSGTKMTVKKGYGDEIELFYPQSGFTASQLPQIGFTIFWLGFISFWTWGASQGSVAFAMFSIPFWIVGFAMLGGIINSIFETQTLKLDRNSLTIKKNRPIRPKRIEFNVRDIQSIRMKQIKMGPYSIFDNFKVTVKAQNTYGARTELPVVLSGVKTVYFFESANEAEQEWVVAVLDNMIKQMNN